MFLRMFNGSVAWFFNPYIYFCIIKKDVNYVRNRGKTVGEIFCIGR
ncbi:hypothetical protein SAMN05421856_101727 [Chryseobacterium taichungense]|uniref:Uncharacterized protein n=1 Tax=Chryseobacterium taichungense TaxID=295069 RepID=A0A1H7WHJ1_9FLAO|nr:hypothetical protein SAMN05421856_101727 [Chryseobacterium taichungense]